MSRLAFILAMLVFPASAFAACPGDTEQAMSCAEGTMWDAEAQACVPLIG